jgi:osomolarity two-component system response regulator SKN7
MNDVLPKPFTKEGMLKSLQKHLTSFLKPTAFSNSPQMAHPGRFTTPNPSHPPLGLNMGQVGQLSAAQSLKDETSPGKSPATATSWHSPNQIPGPSPVGNAPVGYLQQSMRDNPFAMASAHPHPQPGYAVQPNTPLGPPRAPPPRRAMSDMTGGPDEHLDKRQRVYAPPQADYPQ